MADDDGGVEESLTQSARIALTIAMQLGEKLSRAFEEAVRQAQHRGDADARELALRMDAERASARQAVEVVNDPQWWDRATIQDVARMAETAATWEAFDPKIASAAATISTNARERYGVDTHALAGGGANTQHARSTTDHVTAEVLLAEADLLDRVNRPDTAADTERDFSVEMRSGQRIRTVGESAYDSSDRRAGTAAAMRSRGVSEELISSRMTVDASFSTPPRGANSPGQTSSPRSRSGRGKDQHVERTERSR